MIIFLIINWIYFYFFQMAAFRKLTSVQKMAGAAGEGAADNRPVIADNFRKAQPLGERPVFASFR